MLNDKRTIDQLWINLHDGIMLPRSYVRARVAVEYLLENEQLSYEDIIHSSLTESDVYDDAMAWIENHIEISAEQGDARGAAEGVSTTGESNAVAR